MRTRSRPKLITGVDLGMMNDYTAVSVLEKVEWIKARAEGDVASRSQRNKRRPDLRHPVPSLTTEADVEGYHLRHLERFALGTPYTQIAERLAALQDRPPLRMYGLAVVVDVTGVGLPVFEMLRTAGVRNLFGVSIHGGDSVRYDRGICRVPKRDLVSTVQVLLQAGRLKLAMGLRWADALRHELQNFKAKIDLRTGHDSYKAWREGDHDDLVLSLALASWYAENREPDNDPHPYTIVRC